MEKKYTEELNAQIVLSLLKAHGIRKIIASPGTTNMALVASMQHDSYFEMYSCVDERSAAYMACGLAAECGEPVVISCTGATASRNYLPGLTEAYYRKLPVLAITSTQGQAKVGHLIAQVIDRSSKPNDVVNLSLALPVIKDDDDRWECELKVNRAILELKRNGGGPVHLNLPTKYSRGYDVAELPQCRVIERLTTGDSLPKLQQGRIGIFIGAHLPWSREATNAVERFCESNNAVVFCDHTSGYAGKYKLMYSLVAGQQMMDREQNCPDILIQIGEVTGDYYGIRLSGAQVWRVSEDGEIRDTYRKLRYIFQMPEKEFFMHYGQTERRSEMEYFQSCQSRLVKTREEIPDLPFSNVWIASKMAHKIPDGSTIHFGILNSLRSWNFYELPSSVSAASNVGGFGIDGGLSTLIGASLANPAKLYYCVIGDLAFFYDMNVMGNRHVGKNIRVLLINNGKGTEFKQYGHLGVIFGDEADKFISAAGHFGRKSPTLVKNYSEDLGFEYLSASNKTEFDTHYSRFLNPRITEKPMVFEVFTDSSDESLALEMILNIEDNIKGKAKLIKQSLMNSKPASILKSILKR
jgi:2-succinyl-5-enolpyruvyl-6-hydroxy-3-cyclohexene-1-carboxylate synthase